MTTQEQPATEAPTLRPFKIFWNDDGEFVSDLTYTDEQIEEINQMVYAVLSGLLDAKRFNFTMVDEPDRTTDGVNS